MTGEPVHTRIWEKAGKFLISNNTGWTGWINVSVWIVTVSCYRVGESCNFTGQAMQYVISTRHFSRGSEECLQSRKMWNSSSEVAFGNVFKQHFSYTSNCSIRAFNDPTVLLKYIDLYFSTSYGHCRSSRSSYPCVNMNLTRDPPLMASELMNYICLRL